MTQMKMTAAQQQALQASQQKKQAQATENRKLAIEKEREMLQGMTFPAELIPDWFRSALNATLKSKSVVTADCDWPTFKVLLTDEPAEFNMHQMAKALNAIEAASQEQLNTTTEGYIEIQDKIAEMAVEWNVIVGPIRADIADKYK